MSYVNHEWSCEHCGYPTRDVEHYCREMGCAMCERCTAREDDGDTCPVNVERQELIEMG